MGFLVTQKLTSRLMMQKKVAMKDIATKTWRRGTHLMAKMVMPIQSMINMILYTHLILMMIHQPDQNKIVAKDLDLVAVIWVGLSRSES